MRNWLRMSRLRAPIALRIPISLVRSVTVTSMMFMTPMPPTRSEMAATAPSSTVNTRLVAALVWRSVAWLRTLKSAWLGSEMRWRASRTEVTSSWAAVVCFRDAAWTRIWLRLPTPVRWSWTVVRGARATSSWSWGPLVPFLAVTPMTLKFTPLT